MGVINGPTGNRDREQEWGIKKVEGMEGAGRIGGRGRGRRVTNKWGLTFLGPPLMSSLGQNGDKNDTRGNRRSMGEICQRAHQQSEPGRNQQPQKGHIWGREKCQSIHVPINGKKWGNASTNATTWDVIIPSPCP